MIEDPGDSLIPESEMPPGWDSIIPDEEMVGAIPLNGPDASKPVTDPQTPVFPPGSIHDAGHPPMDTPQIMEMIAERLSGPVKAMYEADITRGVSHYDAMLRILDTTAGARQAQRIYRTFMGVKEESVKPPINASKKKPKPAYNAYEDISHYKAAIPSFVLYLCPSCGAKNTQPRKCARCGRECLG
ncbi:MAG: hypothetical protein M0024_10125 [Nitrospiraceae bacterium]|nr:hypothetical protein [Nitrospiraceae bacterium]